MRTINLTDTAYDTALTHAALAGVSVGCWIELLIWAHDAPLPDDGMDDMGFPSPRRVTTALAR